MGVAERVTAVDRVVLAGNAPGNEGGWMVQPSGFTVAVLHGPV